MNETETKRLTKLLKIAKKHNYRVTFVKFDGVELGLLPVSPNQVEQTSVDINSILSALPKTLDEAPGFAALRNWDNPNVLAEGSISKDDMIKRQNEADFETLGYDFADKGAY